MKLIDAHSHADGAPLRTLTPQQYAAIASQAIGPVTVGIHPWDTSQLPPDTLDIMERAATDPRVVAIGEIGLDRMRGASIERQVELFEWQLALAGRVGKPVILHIVRAYDVLLAVRRRLGAKMPVAAVHGFRGNRQLAGQLVRAGFYISIGSRYNVEALSVIPLDRLLVETDTFDAEAASATLESVIESVATALGIPVSELRLIAASNLHRFLGLSKCDDGCLV